MLVHVTYIYSDMTHIISVVAKHNTCVCVIIRQGVMLLYTPKQNVCTMMVIHVLGLYSLGLYVFIKCIIFLERYMT